MEGEQTMKDIIGNSLIAIVFVAGVLLVASGISNIVNRDGAGTDGWPVVKCYDEGKVVFEATYQHCPKFAGSGYSELESGTIIKGECRCSMGDSQ